MAARRRASTVKFQARFAVQRRRLIWAHAAVLLALVCLVAGWLPKPDDVASAVVLGLATVVGAVFYGINSACPACRETVPYPIVARFCPGCGAHLR